MAQVAIAYAGKEEFGIDIHRVVEILKAQRIHSLPQLPPFLCGVVSVRGTVIPLVDLRKRFGISPGPGKGRIIVVRSGNEQVGLLVDGVKEIIDLEPEDVIMPPSIFKGLKTEYLTGIGRRGDAIVILLNLDTLLTSEEKIQIEEISRTVEAGDDNAP